MRPETALVFIVVSCALVAGVVMVAAIRGAVEVVRVLKGRDNPMR